MTHQKWNPEIVLDKIRELHRAGSRLDHSNMKRNHRILLWAANKYVGSWKDSIEAAGLDYNQIRLISESTQRSSKQVIEEITSLHRLNQPLNSNHTQKHNQALYQASLRYFGSWGEAVKAAGFNYNQERKKKPYLPRSKECVITEIKSRLAIGKNLGGGFVFTEDRGLYSAAKKAFPGNKSWEKALQAAGINLEKLPDPREVWTREIVLKTIQEYERKGKPLNSYFLNQNGLGGLTGAGKRIFGSWKAAIEAAGLVYEKIQAVRHNYWTELTVVREIQTYAAMGKKLSLKSTQKERADLIGGAIKCFGSWDRAVTAAGFNYKEHCKVRSTKFWLNQLRPEAYKELIRQNLTRRVKTNSVTKRKGTR